MRNFPRNPDVEAYLDERTDGPRVITNTQHQRLVHCNRCGKAVLTVKRTWAARVNEVHLCGDCFDGAQPFEHTFTGPNPDGNKWSEMDYLDDEA